MYVLYPKVPCGWRALLALPSIALRCIALHYHDLQPVSYRSDQGCRCIDYLAHAALWRLRLLLGDKCKVTLYSPAGSSVTTSKVHVIVDAWCSQPRTRQHTYN